MQIFADIFIMTYLLDIAIKFLWHKFWHYKHLDIAIAHLEQL